MAYRIVTLTPNHAATKYGFPYAIEFRKTDMGWLTHDNRVDVSDIQRFCRAHYGRDYRPKYKRPGKNAKWYVENRSTFYRICFKRESFTTIALMAIR